MTIPEKHNTGSFSCRSQILALFILQSTVLLWKENFKNVHTASLKTHTFGLLMLLCLLRAELNVKMANFCLSLLHEKWGEKNLI